MPKLESHILLTIEQESKKTGYLSALPQTIEWNLWPLGLTFQDVRILPMGKTVDYLKPLTVGEISVSLSFWDLMRGRVSIGDLIFSEFAADISLPRSGKNSEVPQIDLEMWLKRIPIRRFRLDLAHVKIEDLNTGLLTSIQKGRLELENERTSLAIKISPTLVSVESHSLSIHKTNLKIESSLSLSNKKLILGALKSFTSDSYLLASGTLAWDLPHAKIGGFKGQSRLFFDVQKALQGPILETLLGKNKLIGSGQIRSDIQFEGDLEVMPSLAGTLSFQDLRMLSYDLGTGEGKFTWNQGIFKIPEVHFKHPSGNLTLTGTEYIHQPSREFKTLLSTKEVSLHKIFQSLNLATIPVEVFLAAQLPCQGFLQENFRVQCKGKLLGQNLRVWSGQPNKEIVHIPQLAVDGEVTVDRDRVHYSTALSVGKDSSGQSEGVISYENGFEITYDASVLSLEDVEHISRIKFKGKGPSKGKIWGNSQWAQFQMALHPKGLKIDDFFLGDLKSTLSYKSGTLHFNDLEGTLGQSFYKGNVDIHLNNVSILGSLHFEYLQGSEVAGIFKDFLKYQLPIEGNGSANISFQGPLDFFRLSYDLHARLFRGSIWREKFDELQLQVRSEHGHVSIQNGFLKKGRSQVLASGTMSPDRTLDLKLSTNQFPLENLDSVADLGLRVQARLAADVLIKGPIQSPVTLLRANLTQTYLGELPVEDSSLQARVLKEMSSGEFHGFADKILANFEIHHDEKYSSSINGQILDWDFASLIRLVNPKADQLQSTSKLNGKLTWKGHLTDPWNNESQVFIQDLEYQKGSIGIKLLHPVKAQFSEGDLRMNEAVLTGGDNSLKIYTPPSPQSPVDLRVNGKLDLALFSMLTPFFEDLRGMLTLTLNIKAGPQKFDTLGTAYLDRGFLKVQQFPHPIEDLKADLLFTQKKLLINSTKGLVAGGRLFGDGEFEFLGPKRIPARVNLHMENVNFEFPKLVKTGGDIQVSLSGEWFPYLLQGEYLIQSGSITKEFGSEESADDELSLSSPLRKRYFTAEAQNSEYVIPIQLQLHVKTLNALKVQNSLLDGKIDSDIQVLGNSDKPILTGEINIEQDSKLYFRARPFLVQVGQVTLTGEENIDPKLYIVGNARVESYDINLVVQGKASKPTLFLTSQPTLAQQDIVSLLALGTIGEKDSGGQSTYQLGAAVLSNNPIGKEIKNRFGWEMQIAPTFDSENNVAVPKVTFIKQVTPRLGAVASYERGRQSKTDVRLRYQMNRQVYLVGSFITTPLEEAAVQTTQKLRTPYTFGLDLEFKVEYK